MARLLSSSCHGSIQNPRPCLLPSSTPASPPFNFKPTSINNLSSANKLAVKCRQSNYFEESAPKISSSNSPSGSSPKVFVGYSIYKGKAALTFEPKSPEFVPLESGAFKVSREGFVFLQFAPAAGVRLYDWTRKQVFSLSVAEIGSLISLGARDSCEFFHDPNKGRSDEGKVRKVLKVEPFPDGSGHFFNLSVQNKLLNIDENIFMPISKAEFAILVSTFNYILPYLLGWNVFANSIKPDDSRGNNNANPRMGEGEMQFLETKVSLY
ncbi:hypothetical protein V2J09_013034 [Rumex salicifolius]